MNYHQIKHDDMLNGEGLRVTLFVSGCSHQCKECHNPQTWNHESGEEFSSEAYNEIVEQLKKPYVDGLTLSGGDPLYEKNLMSIHALVTTIKKNFPHNKTIWIYTGYKFEDILAEETNKIRQAILEMCDVLVDGEFIAELKDNKYHWAGSTNQRVIDLKKSFKENTVVLFTK